MSPSARFEKVLMPREKTLIEMMFRECGYTEEDVNDFFEVERMRRRFQRERAEICSERARRQQYPPTPQMQSDDPQTD